MNAITLTYAAIGACLGLSVPLAALAQEQARQAASAVAWTPIDPARLMQMRGGMQMPSGLMVSFGIERVVFVNGALVANTSLRIADVSRINAEQAQALVALKEGMVVRIGDGNVLDATGIGNGLIIQNTLDNQDIRATTTLDVGVDTLGTLQQMNTFDALRSAHVNTLGGP